MPAFEDLEDKDFDDDVFDDNVLAGIVDADNVDDDDDFGFAAYDDDFDDDDVDVGQPVDQSASRADDDDDGGGFGGRGGVGNTDTSTVYDDGFCHNKDDDVDQVRVDAFEEEVDASLDVDFQVLLQDFKGNLATPSPTLPPTNIPTPLLTNPPTEATNDPEENIEFETIANNTNDKDKIEDEGNEDVGYELWMEGNWYLFLPKNTPVNATFTATIKNKTTRTMPVGCRRGTNKSIRNNERWNKMFDQFIA